MLSIEYLCLYSTSVLSGGGLRNRKRGTHNTIEIMTEFMGYSNHQEEKIMANVNPITETIFNRIKV